MASILFSESNPDLIELRTAEQIGETEQVCFHVDKSAFDGKQEDVVFQVLSVSEEGSGLVGVEGWVGVTHEMGLDLAMCRLQGDDDHVFVWHRAGISGYDPVKKQGGHMSVDGMTWKS